MSIINESELQFYMHIPRTKVNKNPNMTKEKRKKTWGIWSYHIFFLILRPREYNNPDIDNFWF